jgi:PAS domain S-box-containing protein
MPNDEDTLARLTQELQAANEKYDSLFQGAGDSIFIIDAKTLRIIEANTNASRRLGYSQDELLQLTLLDIEMTCDSDSEDNLAWESTFSGTQVYECEYRRKDGTKIPVEVSSRLTQYDHREVLQNFVRDITERKQVEEQRLELILEKERMQILANFISRASHEFRTPLAIIQTSAHVLGRTSDPEKKEQKIHDIEDQVRDIITLIDSLTLMAQLDVGDQHFQFAEVNLNEIFQGVCRELQLGYPAGNIDFVFELSEEPLMLQGHSAYLKQALQQIVENAVLHSPAGQAVIVRTEHRGAYAVAEITDTGDGISDEALPHIFERFFRADKAGTTRGFGLGLPIAQKIIELHQGSIEVESEVTKGSTFRILLPLS